MCTSFVLYAEKTYIGMNFDISERPIMLQFKEEGQFLILQKEGNNFLPAFGTNRAGTFMNLLMVEPNEAGVYRRGKDYIHIIKIFDHLLGGQLDVDTLAILLHEKKVVNVPNLSVHSMIVMKDRHAWVIEPGRSTITLSPTGKNFLALTNFPLSDFVDQEYTAVAGGGAERYKICYQSLLENQHAFTLEQGFSILEKTAQTGGDFPTQFSMIIVPEDQVVYFSIKKDFSRRYVFSFADQLIRAGTGLTQPHQLILNPKGVLLSELEKLS